MKYRDIKLFGAILAFFSICLIGKPAESAALVIGLMEGYSFSQGGNTIGINNLNTDIKDRLAGENYYSRVFEWDAVEEATNYFKLFDDSTNYLLGYSRGGYQALRVANALGEDNIAVDKLVQLDPVRCGNFLDTYGADNVAACAGISLALIATDDSYTLGGEDLLSSVVSVGSQVVPDNVVEAVNYYQTGGGITGEENVYGALNVNANQLINDPSLFHGSIDEDRTLRNIILNDIESRVDDNVLMTGQGGSDDFGTLALTRNDDGSTDAIDIPFTVSLNGGEYDKIYINNNGNVTLDGPYGSYTPSGFEGLPVEMIAPFWSDVDTRCADCGEVYLNVPTSDVAIVTWKDVGFYNADSSKTNTFQLVLRDRNDLEGKNTDVEFRYGDLQWTTGDASGGTNGLGGTHAFAGFTGGEGDASQTLLGSGTSNILTLNQRSNTGRAGRWAYALRNGRTPGTDPDNPLLPDVQEDGWHFQYETTQIEEIIWSDPEVVFGYDYSAQNNINFRSFVLPELGDNSYELWLGNPSNPQYIADVIGGSEYFFSDLGFDSGLDFFRVLGVEEDLDIVPGDVTAFVTGLTFEEIGEIQWRQSPLYYSTDDIASTSVDEPGSIAGILSISGLILIRLRRRRR